MKLLLVIAPLLCGFTAQRNGATNTGATWPSPNVTYRVDSSGITSITGDADIAAVYEAFAAWNNVGCSTFRFVDGGLTTSTSGNTLIRFVHTAGAWAGPPGAIAYTAFHTTAGVIDSAPISIDDFDLSWATNGDLQAFDLQSVLTHELGHALGLMHSADPQTTMYFAGRKGNTFFRTLSDDDRSGVCFLYPVASMSCTDDGDCPLLTGGAGDVATFCMGGACVGGSRSYGEDCLGASPGTCSGGTTCLRFDMAPASDPGVCAQACPCPGSDVCDGSACAPRAASCDATCNGANEICVPNVDGAFACVHTCLADANCNVGAGEFCFDPVNASNAGVCRKRGPKANGEACSAPSECNSLVCGSDLDGSSTCVDPNATPPPLPDSGSPDGGPADGGDPGGGTLGDGDGSLDGGDDSSPNGSGSVDGGCTAAIPSMTLLLGAIVVALVLRRFLRGDGLIQ